MTNRPQHAPPWFSGQYEYYFDLSDPVDVFTRRMWIDGVIEFYEIPLTKSCIEKGLRNDMVPL